MTERGEPPALHPSAQRVADALADAGIVGRVHEFEATTKTSADAARALGCELAAIASTIVFIADGSPIVVIKSGAHRVDVAHLAAELGVTEIRQADAREVRAATGQPIGGVAPVNWPTSPPVYIDATLADLEQIWSAAGTPNAVFPTTFDELRRVTGARPVAVTAER